MRIKKFIQVIIKDNAANYQVFRTSMMKGDSTAYMSNAVANFANGITSLNAAGFSVGNSGIVNTNTNVYHYQAFGNAWNIVEAFDNIKLP